MRLVAAILLLSLVAATGVASATPITVASGRELIQALTSLQDSGGAIELQKDVWLSKADLEGAELPAQVSTGTTVILQGGGESLRTLLPEAAAPPPPVLPCRLPQWAAARQNALPHSTCS